MSLSIALAVFCGGGLGALARYSVMRVVSNFVGIVHSFPWGTLAVNLLGGLIVGFAVALLAGKIHLTETARFFFFTGFLGGFTTFSAFTHESFLMFERGDYTMLSAYVLASVIGAMLMFATGLWLGRLV